MNPNIRNWARNDSFSAGHLNEPLPTVRSVRTITGVNGIEVTQTEAGTTIKGPPAPYNGGMGVEHYLATIVSTGPDGAADRTDARYWVKLQWVVNGSTYDKIAVNNVVPPKVEISAGNSPDAFQATVTCTNLSEWLSASGSPAGGTHLLPTDGSRLVHVWGFYDVGDTSGNRGHRYVMSEATGDPTGGTVLTLGSSAERLTADSTTWDRESDDRPVELWVGCGCYYDDSAGTPKLMQHMRKITLTRGGKGDSISGETDYEIDTPDACS